MLSAKPADWPAEVSATPEVLSASESFDVAHHALSKATSRKPQAFLFDAVRERLASLVADPVGARVVALLGDFGTVKTVGMLCEELAKLPAADLVQGEHSSKVLAAVAKRVDETKGLRHAFLEKAVAAATPARVAEHAGARRFLAAVACDPSYAAAVAKTVQSKSVKAFFAAQLTSPKPVSDAVQFTSDLLASSAASAEAAVVDAVCDAVNAAVAPLMKPDAAHRPRPEVMLALARAPSDRVAGGICRAAAKWQDLPKHVSGPVAEALAAAAQHAPTADAQALADRVAAVAPLQELVTKSTHSARLIVALRGLGLLNASSDRTAEAAIDAVEDTLTCQSASCATASRAAAQRALERMGADAAAGSRPRRTRPTVAVVESDDEADEAKPSPARKSARAEKKKVASRK